MSNAYQTKIQKALANLSFAVNPATLAKFRIKVHSNGGSLEHTIHGDDEFRPVRAYYNDHGGKCDLCGHWPIKRVFVIQSQVSGKEAHIGSECATNYIHADVVKGLCKVFQLEYNKIVNPIKFKEELELLNWAVENRSAGRQFTCKYDLINGGDPNSVIRKINSGKPINKREKEVMLFWETVRRDPEGLAAAGQLYVGFRSFRIWYRQRERNRRLALADLRRFFPDLETHIIAKEGYELVKDNGSNLSYAASRIVCYAENGLRLSHGDVEKYVAQIKEESKKDNEVDEIKGYFDTAYNADLTESQKGFVGSLYAFWKNRGYLTEKQLDCLIKTCERVA